MKKLKATVDMYVDIVDNMSEEDALGDIQEFIEGINCDQSVTKWGPIILNAKYELCEE